MREKYPVPVQVIEAFKKAMATGHLYGEPAETPLSDAWRLELHQGYWFATFMGEMWKYHDGRVKDLTSRMIV